MSEEDRDSTEGAGSERTSRSHEDGGADEAAGGTASDGTADTDAVDGETADGEAEKDELVEVGDGREKHVTVVTTSGREVSHGDVYLKHSEAEFIVSPDAEFPPAETTRYQKSNLDRVEVTQHHAGCFITTATAGEGVTLDVLRGFRDDVMSASPPGRALLWFYDLLSPPIAETLARYPEARSTRVVRALVERCADVARRRERSESPVGRSLRSLALTTLYVVGVCVAMVAHLWLSTAAGRDGDGAGRL